MRKKIIRGMSIIVPVLALLVLAGAAMAATSYTLFGDAVVVSGGHPGHAAELTSDATAPGYGGVALTSTTGTTVASLTVLGTDYMITAGDCGGGSPRFQVDTAVGNIFVYIGPYPNFTECDSGWISTGNLLASADLRVDTSQIAPGTQYNTWAGAVALAGSNDVTGIKLVVDSGWVFATGGQTVQVDNITVNNDVITFEPATDKQQCKKGGWETLFRADGTTFKNQGDCVSFTNNGK